ncbi:MAG: hypothetical protein HY264_05495 [Chloroflexi bacterium]|nr:hypothetical protein [Chloroflexota bacterium]
MDPRDLLGAFPDGMACTVCDEVVPAARIHLLARRDDIAFVQIDCPACRSTSLGFLGAEAFGSGADDHGPAEPVDADDVIEMHELLSTWDGDLRSLLAGSSARPLRGEPSTPPR